MKNEFLRNGIIKNSAQAKMVMVLRDAGYSLTVKGSGLELHKGMSFMLYPELDEFCIIEEIYDDRIVVQCYSFDSEYSYPYPREENVYAKRVLNSLFLTHLLDK